MKSIKIAQLAVKKALKTLSKFAMPQIFPKPGDTALYTYVYRVLDTQGRTPYNKAYEVDDKDLEGQYVWSDQHNYWRANQKKLDFSKYEELVSQKQSQQPTPRSDKGFERKDLDSLGFFGKSDKKFAFRDVEEYNKWFSDNERANLNALGFKLTPVKAKKAWGSDSQVFYEEYKDEE